MLIKNKLLKNKAAQVAVEFLIVFIIFSGIMFYIYSLAISILGLQHSQYFGFMVGRTITASAKRYGSGSGTSNPGVTKYGAATVVQQWANNNRQVDSVGRLVCSINAGGLVGYRGLLHYSSAVGPRVASTTGIACKVSAPGLLPIGGDAFYVAFDELMGSDPSDDHIACAMNYERNWAECIDEEIPDDKIIILDNGS